LSARKAPWFAATHVLGQSYQEGNKKIKHLVKKNLQSPLPFVSYICHIFVKARLPSLPTEDAGPGIAKFVAPILHDKPS
jgi:hypothetical protein